MIMAAVIIVNMIIVMIHLVIVIIMTMTDFITNYHYLFLSLFYSLFKKSLTQDFVINVPADELEPCEAISRGNTHDQITHDFL